MLDGFETIVPKECHVGILKLCRMIGTGTSPVRVRVVPEPQSMPNECGQNVQTKIQRCGGSIQHGWIIWEVPNVLIEGEFHAVWQSPAGELLCVSAREDEEGELLFLPDRSRKLCSLPVPNMGISWPYSKPVERFLEAEAAFQRFKNRHTDPNTRLAGFPKKEHEWHVRQIELVRQKIMKDGA